MVPVAFLATVANLPIAAGTLIIQNEARPRFYDDEAGTHIRQVPLVEIRLNPINCPTSKLLESSKKQDEYKNSFIISSS